MNITCRIDNKLIEWRAYIHYEAIVVPVVVVGPMAVMVAVGRVICRNFPIDFP